MRLQDGQGGWSSLNGYPRYPRSQRRNLGHPATRPPAYPRSKQKGVGHPTEAYRPPQLKIEMGATRRLETGATCRRQVIAGDPE